MTTGDGYTDEFLVRQPGTGQWAVNPAVVNSGRVESGFLWPGTHNPRAADIAEAAHHEVALDPDFNLMPWAGGTFTWDIGARLATSSPVRSKPFDPR